MTLIMMLSLLSGSHAAERGTVAAEHSRLTEEMRGQAARERWEAVDSHYRQLLALRGADMRYEDHWLGAQASSNQGDVQSTWQRLKHALDEEFTDEALTWWATLNVQYGEVHLIVKADEPTVSLTIAEMPFEPEKRATIAAAQAALQADRAFHGLLPLGQYQLNEMSFEIIGGPAVREVIR
ncbi:MAG: hypothetical protein P8R54_01220 [Myxococcota bacterium]|nr:hypothetical protein [Myxococcota bacterium]